MIVLIFGLACIAFFVYAVVPFDSGLHWTEEFIFVLKGSAPIIAIVLGALSILIGLADISDRRNARKEALIQKQHEEAETQKEKQL